MKTTTLTTALKTAAISIVLLACAAAFCPSCVLYRAVAYGSEDIYDYRVFPQDTVRRSSRPWHFAEQAPERRLLDTLVWDADRYVDTAVKYPGRPVTLGELMEDGGPGSIIVIQNDTIKFEEYYGGFDRSTVTTVFSVSKSLTSLLCGVAVREGYIRSVDDPVTDYLPELLDADTMFRHLTVEHLLQCRSGLKFNENYSVNPFSGMARLYYGPNAMAVVKRLRFSTRPGEKHYYSSMDSQILGLVIERAVGRSYAEYMQEKVWEPLGMEYDASVSLDDSRHRVAKSYGGITTCSIDLAKVGRLYLSMGNWNGQQIIDSAWVKKSICRDNLNYFYAYCWYNTSRHIVNSEGTSEFFGDWHEVAERFDELGVPKDGRMFYTVGWKKGNNSTGCQLGPGYHAEGLYGQYLFILPEKNLVIVRLGERKQIDYPEVFDKLAAEYLSAAF